MWPNSFWPNSYWTRTYWEKVGAGGFIPPPPSGSGVRVCYLPIMGIGSWLMFMIVPWQLICAAFSR